MLEHLKIAPNFEPSVLRIAPDFEPSVLRRHVLHMAYRGQSVHIPCAFSLIEVVSLLYTKYLRYDIGDPLNPDRDYLVLSKGHGVMALYACFRELGWLTESDLDNYLADGSKLRGLCESNIPGLEVTSGSLGHGLPVAIGIALGLKMKGRSQKVFCIVGDGELNEGPIWEGMMLASHHRLENLVVIVDANQFQAMGRTSEVLDTEPLGDKCSSFGFATSECDGHDLQSLDSTMQGLLEVPDKPKALIARTLKGKGVSFMEGKNEWHYTRLSNDTLKLALSEIAPRELV
jgi:transketolase